MFGCGFLTGCSSNSQNNENGASATTTQEQPNEEQQQDSITAHGSAYEKAETVKATTTLSGEFKSIAVDEWLKNPEGLDVISDTSSLQAIAADDDVITFTQNGETSNGIPTAKTCTTLALPIRNSPSPSRTATNST